MDKQKAAKVILKTETSTKWVSIDQQKLLIDKLWQGKFLKINKTCEYIFEKSDIRQSM